MFGRLQRSRRIAALYGRIIAASRQPGFYRDLGVPDTIEGRYEMLVVHCHLVLRRLHALGRPAVWVSQYLFEYMLDDLDRSAREIGVGDMGIAKQMKRLGKGFYGRAAAYDAALNAGDAELLAAAVTRNVLDSDVVGKEAQGLAAYLLAADAHLATFDLEKVLAMEALFPTLGAARQVAA